MTMNQKKAYEMGREELARWDSHHVSIDRNALKELLDTIDGLRIELTIRDKHLVETHEALNAEKRVNAVHEKSAITAREEKRELSTKIAQLETEITTLKIN